MKILFLCTAFNSLSQRLALVLKSRGHAVTVELALSSDLMLEAAELALPDIIICPFLTKRLPLAVYARWLTLVVHPGPPGDAGPSALDWTLIGDLGEYQKAEDELAAIDATHCAMGTRRSTRSHWGVTVLQAIEALDAGPVWAFDQFELDQKNSKMSKSDLYRGPITRAAVNAVICAIEIIEIVAKQNDHSQTYSPNLNAPHFARTHCVSNGMPFQGGLTHDRPLLRASSRDFFSYSKDEQHGLIADTIVRRVRCGDSQPGTLTSLFGTPMFVYNAIAQKAPLPAFVMERSFARRPGSILATRDGAVLVNVGADYPIWISHLRRPKSKSDEYLHPKLPATMALVSAPDDIAQLELLSDVKEWSTVEAVGLDTSLPWQRQVGTYQQVWVELESYGTEGFKIGYIHSEFYNGAFSTSQCQLLLQAIRWTLAQSGLKAIVMLGGSGYFSNGIALNVIEGSPDPSAEGWANINAIDDCVQTLLAPAGVVTFAAIRGNAAAGGLALATAADVVLCAETSVLNPHYRGIGLYGSEFHTYSWYERCGAEVATKFVHDMLPISAQDACDMGLIDMVIENNQMDADGLLSEIKSVVRNIMTATILPDDSHVGAPWTKPLRRVCGQEQILLSKCMLRNKAKFLAYIFADGGPDRLTLQEHFQKYRKQELDQMTLDFFHPHRNERFASRCTAFVRKLVPATTPLRFALHRRCQHEHWHEATRSTLHRDEEELDDFDDLGAYPASAAVTRLPSCRPEYIQSADHSEEMAHQSYLRNDSISSRASTLCSTSMMSEPVLSHSSSSAGSNTPLMEPLTPVPEKMVPSHDKNIDGEIAVALDGQPNLMSLSQPLEFQDMDSMPLPMSLGSVAVPTKPSFWSCYYSETGSERQ